MDRFAHALGTLRVAVREARDLRVLHPDAARLLPHRGELDVAERRNSAVEIHTAVLNAVAAVRRGGRRDGL